MSDYDNQFSPEARGFSHSDPYDTRTYYQGRGHGQREYMPDGRGSYEAGDLETRWDHYNASNYGRNPGTARKEARQNYRDTAGHDSRYASDDYRYTSGNREWHLLQAPHPGRSERFQDPLNYRNRYRDMYLRNQGGRDVFEWVGEGISRMWNGVTGHRDHPHHPDRDRDYYESYRDEPRAYGPNEENQRQYGSRPIQGYEKGHEWADDTPNRQRQAGDRDQRWHSDDYPPERHR